jgi:hypothetical protein
MKRNADVDATHHVRSETIFIHENLLHPRHLRSCWSNAPHRGIAFAIRSGADPSDRPFVRS